jgi:hypothetical protein
VTYGPERVADVERVRGRGRVWVVYSHLLQPAEAYVRDVRIPARLDRLGRRLETFAADEARAYLYDLR